MPLQARLTRLKHAPASTCAARPWPFRRCAGTAPTHRLPTASQVGLCCDILVVLGGLYPPRTAAPWQPYRRGSRAAEAAGWWWYETSNWLAWHSICPRHAVRRCTVPDSAQSRRQLSKCPRGSCDQGRAGCGLHLVPGCEGVEGELDERVDGAVLVLGGGVQVLDVSATP